MGNLNEIVQLRFRFGLRVVERLSRRAPVAMTAQAGGPRTTGLSFPRRGAWEPQPEARACFLAT